MDPALKLLFYHLLYFLEINRETTSTAVTERHRQLNSALKLTLVDKYEPFSSEYERCVLSGKYKLYNTK